MELGSQEVEEPKGCPHTWKKGIEEKVHGWLGSRMLRFVMNRGLEEGEDVGVDDDELVDVDGVEEEVEDGDRDEMEEDPAPASRLQRRQDPAAKKEYKESHDEVKKLLVAKIRHALARWIHRRLRLTRPLDGSGATPGALTGRKISLTGTTSDAINLCRDLKFWRKVGMNRYKSMLKHGEFTVQWTTDGSVAPAGEERQPGAGDHEDGVGENDFADVEKDEAEAAAEKVRKWAARAPHPDKARDRKKHNMSDVA